MKKTISAKELKAHPVKGFYRWRHGKDTCYHSGLAHVFHDNESEAWMCDTL